MPRSLIDCQEQIRTAREWIDRSLRNISDARVLVVGSDAKEAERGRFMLGINYPSIVQHAYCIGQIKWRRDLGDPTEDFVFAVRQFAHMLHDCEVHKAEASWYWADLVAFIAVILGSEIPHWIVASRQAAMVEYARAPKRLKPWEINLGSMTALAVGLHTGKLPDCWPRFAADADGRSGLKRIRERILIEGRLFEAVQGKAWGELPAIVAESDANYRKRGSSEASLADVFGDGPYNDRSINFVAAAILRIGQRDPAFPRGELATPHLWRWGDVDVSGIAPGV